ncbi:MAG: maleylacetate reductase [Alphaproteobacteria bacterium]|nr:maleylacetate reductase [Alphaproteobacteria bacterium]
MTRAFVFEGLPSRVIFGVGALGKLGAELDRLGLKRALVLATPPQRDQAADVQKQLGPRAVGLHDQAVMHVPVDVAKAGEKAARDVRADCTVAVGGGSTIGLAKAIALSMGLPVVAVPTTFAGSEMTPIWGLTEGSVKRTGRDLKVLPRLVVYDPNLTLTLPAAIAGPSGLNAIAHCVEALYAENANPIVSLMAEEGIRALNASLPTVVARGDDLEARSEALYGAWLAGCSLGMVGMALHHKLCHTLGGTFNLPHAETHSIVLPYATAYNRDAAPDAMARIRRALGGADDAARGLYDLGRKVGAPKALAEIGLKVSDLDRAAEIATQNPYYNPRPVTRDGVRVLLEDAFAGHRP